MKRVLIGLLIAGAAYALPAFASTPLPQPTGYVNDFANVMSAETKASLESELVQFNASTTNEIAVVTVPSMNGDYIENYAVNLFKQWGIGTKKNDNGVLLVLAIAEHKLRIEVGYGLEGALPDSTAAAIIADMTPLLKSNDYDGAITLGTHEIMQATQGEYTASATVTPDLGGILNIAFVILGLFIWLVAVFARSKSIWAGGIVGALAGAGISTFLGWWILGGVGVTLALTLFGLLLDYAVSSAYKEATKNGVTPPWWGGGVGSGWSSGSGGFGGFGGGSSGGGGASGGW